MLKKSVTTMFTTKHKNKISPQYSIAKLGRILEPNLDEPNESGGVFNPASLEINNQVYVYYRAVQKPNYSRIKLAIANFENNTISFEKSDKIILEPKTPYEYCKENVSGGVEDPCTVTIENTHYMVYVGRGSMNDKCPVSRVAIASSKDGINWTRLGRMVFAPFKEPELRNIDPNDLDNKDVVIYPTKFGNTYVSMQRFTFPKELRVKGYKTGIWLAFSKDLINWYNLTPFYFGQNSWESLKVGAGTPPVLTKYGWMQLYHGLEGTNNDDPNRTYRAGIIITDKTDPTKVLYISKKPVMEPQSNEERFGIVNNVVFPSGIFKVPNHYLYSRGFDTGGENFGILYGMSDSKTGLALMHLN